MVLIQFCEKIAYLRKLSNLKKWKAKHCVKYVNVHRIPWSVCSLLIIFRVLWKSNTMIKHIECLMNLNLRKNLIIRICDLVIFIFSERKNVVYYTEVWFLFWWFFDPLFAQQIICTASTQTYLLAYIAIGKMPEQSGPYWEQVGVLGMNLKCFFPSPWTS